MRLWDWLTRHRDSNSKCKCHSSPCRLMAVVGEVSSVSEDRTESPPGQSRAGEGSLSLPSSISLPPAGEHACSSWLGQTFSVCCNPRYRWRREAEDIWRCVWLSGQMAHLHTARGCLWEARLMAGFCTGLDIPVGAARSGAFLDSRQ